MRLGKIETWMAGHERLVEERHETNVKRLDHINHKLGNGTPGVFLRRDEAQRMVEARDIRLAEMGRRIAELEDG